MADTSWTAGLTDAYPLEIGRCVSSVIGARDRGNSVAALEVEGSDMANNALRASAGVMDLMLYVNV